MLEELQTKIETAHGRLSGLSEDIARMKSIEDALVETDQSINESANELKSFVDAAGRTQQSLVDAADAFKDAANTLENIDVTRIIASVANTTKEVEYQITKNHEIQIGRLSATETRLNSALASHGQNTAKQIVATESRLNSEIASISQAATKQIEATTADRIDRIDRHISSAVVASGEATIKQIDSSAAQIDDATKASLQPLKLIAGTTLILAVGILVVAVMILLTA